MLLSLHVRGYRSLRDLRVRFGRITVVTGGNGVERSIYRALALLQRMAGGRFVEFREAKGITSHRLAVFGSGDLFGWQEISRDQWLSAGESEAETIWRVHLPEGERAFVRFASISAP